MGKHDNRLVRWAIYNLAWWIVKREIRQRRRKFIAVGVIGAVIGAGFLLARQRSE